MTVNHNNSTIDGWTYTEKGWEPYDLAAATVITTQNGKGYLRVPHRTDETFHRIRCKKAGHKPVLRDGVWHWVKA